MKQLKEADIVTLHCPLTADTQDLINADTLKLMKPTAYLINTGRGPLVNEQALVEALQNNIIAAAAIDVMVKEPPEKITYYYKPQRRYQILLLHHI